MGKWYGDMVDMYLKQNWYYFARWFLRKRLRDGRTADDGRKTTELKIEKQFGSRILEESHFDSFFSQRVPS